MATRKITYHSRRDSDPEHVTEKGALFLHVVSNLCTPGQNSVTFGAYAMKLDEPMMNQDCV